MLKLLRFIAALLLAGSAMSTTVLADGRPSKLVIGLLPGESAPTVIRLNEPLRAYLEKRLGIPVEMVVGANYAATGAALRFGRLDMAYLGPVTYILQGRKVKLEPIARPSHAGVGPSFKAVIIVPTDSPAQKLADLRGKEIAFGDPASTSGTWVPQYLLWDAGRCSGAGGAERASRRRRVVPADLSTANQRRQTGCGQSAGVAGIPADSRIHVDPA